MVIHKAVARFENEIYAISRIVIGLLIFQHSFGKWLGGIDFTGNVFGQLMFWAALIETIIGVFLVFGLWTRLGALLGIVELVIAYFMVHASIAVLPVTNGGELALLYVAAFIALLARGNGIWSLERMWSGKEYF